MRYSILSCYLKGSNIISCDLFEIIIKGGDAFDAKVNIEVQWASEPVIAAIERNGGTITTAYYDPHSLLTLHDVDKFFNTGNIL